jgi:alkylation response protein AidB-like acyl-CoA dehydrogenase
VHFDLDAEQRSLQSVLRGYCDHHFPVAAARRAGGPDGLDRVAWRGLAELGAFSLAVPESLGGLGLGEQDAVIAFGVLGAALVAGPLIGTALAAGLVPGALEGTSVVAAVERPDAPATLVEGLRDADSLLILDSDGAWLVEKGQLDGELLAGPTDPTTPVTRIGVLPQGERLAGPDAAAVLLRRGNLLGSALLVGIASQTLQLATAYAKQRSQFGRMIGAFQAVKHLLADQLTRAEVATASVHAAAVLLDEQDSNSPRAVAGARVMAGHAAVANAKTNIHIHGGMGFTWEVDAHLYLKRAWVVQTSFGTVDEAAELVAQYTLAQAST